MFDKLLQIFNGEDQQLTIFSLLRGVKFDIDPQQPILPFEKYIALSYNIEDAKGNAGYKGNFFVSNLRIIWQMKQDPSINLSFGLDAITMMDLKTSPSQWNTGLKHLLTVKTQNPSKTRYEFKFAGYTPEDLNVFNRAIEIFKKASETREFRGTNTAVKFQNQYQVMQGEQLKNTYHEAYFVEDQTKYFCKLFITNVRLVIIKQGEKKMNYGISWLMMRSVEYVVQDDSFKGVRLYCQGLLAPKIFIVGCKRGSDTKKLEEELKSFCQTYSKSPILGFEYEQTKKIQAKPTTQSRKEIDELQAPKINLIRRKKNYTSADGLSSILNTQFNAELGLMVEKFPEGTNRQDLWEILK